jgi:hypothetical protein
MSVGEQVVERLPLGAEGGQSGNTLERVRLGDGTELIHKRVVPGQDWISRATGDDGRVVRMWDEGVFERFPPEVDHAMVALESEGEAWSIYMRDVSASLIPRTQRLDRDAVFGVLRAVAEMHRTFRDADLPELCSIEDRCHLLSPRTIRRELHLGNPSPSLTAGWEAFSEHVPSQIADVIMPLVEDPTPVADELRRGDQTLVHGDLRLDNLGRTRDGIILLDWGSMTGAAPPAVEFMWFLGFDAMVFDCPRDEVVSMFRDLYGDHVDDRAMDLAFIGGFVHLGCHLGLSLLGRSPTMARLQGSDEAKRAAAQAELAWWLSRVQRALDTWSPG